MSSKAHTVRRLTSARELRSASELLRLFIQQIEVGERTEKHFRSSNQSIRIVYCDIGAVDSAMEHGEVQPYIAPPLSEVSVSHACKKMVFTIYAVMRDNKAYVPCIPSKISA